MTRTFLVVAILATATATASPQDKGEFLPSQQPKSEQQQKEQEPPEEDESLQPKVYTFNPLQATKEVQIGDYYFKRRSWKAAAGRYGEATKWNPGLADAWFKLGEAREKLNLKSEAREAFSKFLEVAPEDKRAPDVKKKLAAKN